MYECLLKLTSSDDARVSGSRGIDHFGSPLGLSPLFLPSPPFKSMPGCHKVSPLKPTQSPTLLMTSKMCIFSMHMIRPFNIQQSSQNFLYISCREKLPHSQFGAPAFYALLLLATAED